MSRSGSCCRAGRSRTDGDGISEGAAGTTAGVRPHLGKARLCRPPPLHLSAQRGAGRTVALPLHPPDRAAGEGCGDGAREVGQFTSVLGGWMSLTAKRSSQGARQASSSSLLREREQAVPGSVGSTGRNCCTGISSRIRPSPLSPV